MVKDMANFMTKVVAVRLPSSQMLGEPSIGKGENEDVMGTVYRTGAQGNASRRGLGDKIALALHFVRTHFAWIA